MHMLIHVLHHGKTADYVRVFFEESFYDGARYDGARHE